MNKQWLLANLWDAQAALKSAIEEIDELAVEDDCVAKQLIAEAYIKLNYAWNSRNADVDAKRDENYSEWIKYPKEMDSFSE